MVDVIGHLGMALLWLAPAWVVFAQRTTAGTFVLSGFAFGMLPDVDLYLRQTFATVKHHGIFHTVVAVTLLALAIGPILGTLVETVASDRDWLSTGADGSSYRFGFFAVWTAGLAHVFADMLSAPDIAEAVEPLWPLYRQSMGLDLVWYNNPWFNWGLLVAGVLVNAGLYVYNR
ncbi:metal-dependent hydrolase [Halobacteriaceae archaeon GCM10025711]